MQGFLYDKLRWKNIRIENGGLRLPKINGLIELSMHRPIKPDGTLKSVTVTHEPDGKWYFSILVEYPAEEVELSDGLQKFLLPVISMQFPESGLICQCLSYI